jgi:hypothetical protein
LFANKPKLIFLTPSDDVAVTFSDSKTRSSAQFHRDEWPPAPRWLLAQLTLDPEDEAVGSSETLVHIQATRRYVPERHHLIFRSEELKSLLSHSIYQ